MKRIKEKGFEFTFAEDIDTAKELRDMDAGAPIDFSKIRVGLKTLEDATLRFGTLDKINPRVADKQTVLHAIDKNDYEQMRDISNFFFKTSGIYSELCKYLAYLYRYDWMVTPYVNAKDEKTNKKVLDSFNKVLKYLDDFEVKKIFRDIALKVIRNGCFYGYLVNTDGKTVIQELPIRYCRSRFFINNRPVVEFNMSYFNDRCFEGLDKEQILKLFPSEFRRGYKAFLNGDLKGTKGWYTLNTDNAIKFNIDGEDFPTLIATIPAIIDLDSAQDLDRRKMAQKLLKIIIQKLPIDKNGDLVFDIDEGQQLHNNAVRMLSKAIGVDVLTTFADVEVADMADHNTTTSVDELEKVERAVYNQAGISQMLFNTDGNIALEKSILNDESSIYGLLLQFEGLLNDIIGRTFNTSPKKFYFKVQLLTTTIYNYKELAKMYKEQMQLGYSKMLAQIALGQSQSSVLANAYFENDLLDLIHVFIPPMSSSTMSADVLESIGNNGNGNEGAGRPTNESKGESVTEKTMQNKESES